MKKCFWASRLKGKRARNKISSLKKSVIEISNQLSAIARIVRQDWKRIYFGAEPYLRAMSQLDNIRDMYFEDTAENIVRYFLSNATTWKGETARAVKTKLKQLLNATTKA